jgi:hypothetical protein
VKRNTTASSPEQPNDEKSPLSPRLTAFYWLCVEHMQVAMGLQDWRITRSRKNAKGVMACVHAFDAEQRQVAMTLGHAWRGYEHTPEDVVKTAVHELLHVALHDFECQDIGVEHRLINMIEPIVSQAFTPTLLSRYAESGTRTRKA